MLYANKAWQDLTGISLADAILETDDVNWDLEYETEFHKHDLLCYETGLPSFHREKNFIGVKWPVFIKSKVVAVAGMAIDERTLGTI